LSRPRRADVGSDLVIHKVAFVLSLACLTACHAKEFSEQHSSEIEGDCYQTQSCAANNTPPVGSAVQDCVSYEDDTFNHASASQQQYFLDAYDRCASAAGCNYVVCATSTATAGWAGQNMPLLTYDCQQRLACNIANGKAQSMTAVDECVTQQGNAANGSVDLQTTYAKMATDCNGLVSCAWLACN
jgi:hypothetical protein